MAGIIKSRQGGDPESTEKKPKGGMLPDPNAGKPSPGGEEQAAPEQEEGRPEQEEGMEAEEGQPTEEGEPATADEQEAFKRVELAAIDILYNEKLNPQFVKMLQDGADTPGVTMAKVAMQIFAKIDQEAGGRIPETVIIPGAAQTLDVVRDMAEKMGLCEVSEQVLGRAVQEMIKIAGEMYEIDPAELEQLIAEFQGESQQMVAQQEQYAGAA